MKLVCSVLISALVIAFVQQSLQDDENAIPVVISRRLSGDIHYSDYPDKFSTCNDMKSSSFTYLVEERLCVASSDLQRECSSLIIPNKTSNLIAVASASSSTSTLVIDAGAGGGAMFYFKDTEQLINKSVCDIDSLEVYRGREQAIEISHNGFTLSNSGAFEINYDETTYSRDEYEGELYRMNLSCFGEGLPESGCLFFKVRGIANITNAKFNCTVPGTLTDFNKECKYTTTTNTISTTTSPSTTLSTTTNSLSPTSGFELGGTYFLIVVVCGVLVVALLIAIVLVCCMVCLLRRKMRPSSAQTDDCCKQQSNLQDLDAKLSSPRYHTAVPQEYETLFSNRDDFTFMVEEKKCLKNDHKDLFNEDYKYKRPVLHIMKNPELNLSFPDDHEHKKDRICHIVRLEVVRGVNKSYEIDHSGFSLANGTLSVHEGMLAYNLTEYAGELYRIKLSCAGNEIILDYLFVVWGKAIVTGPKFNCTIPGTIHKYSSAPPTTITATTVIADSGTKTDGQEPIKISVIVGGGAGSFAVLVLVLGLLCTCAVVCKKRRVKVSTIRSRVLERNGLTINRGSDTRNEKDVVDDQCIIYAIPGELVQSNVYGCGGLASNPAYKERSASYSRSGEHIEFDDSAIPRHLNPCYEHSNSIEEPVYQEIIPRQPTMSVLSSRTDKAPHKSVKLALACSTSVHGST